MKVLTRVRWFFEDVSDLIAYTWEQYPARSISTLAGVIVFVCASQGIVVDESSVLEALAVVLPILLGGNAIHNRVSPV